MDTWTVFTTLITGMLFGFFVFAGAVAWLIKIDDKKRHATNSKKLDDAFRPHVVGKNPFVPKQRNP